MDKNTRESGKAYSHLSLQECGEIAIGLETGESRRSTARRPGRDPSAISREIRRNNNTPLRSVKYRAAAAQKRAGERKKNSRRRERPANPLLRLRAEHQLKHQHRAPQEIAGRLPQEFPGMKANYESLYQWIYYDRPDLAQYLARGRKKRHKRAVSKKSRAGKIPRRAGISPRPQEINSRREAGTVVSRAGKHAAAVFVERKYRLYPAVKMKDKSAREMRRAAVKALGRLPAVMRKSITYDNGLENALHDKINEALGAKSYFRKPYHSWEKGGVENRNGILRRFFPKKRNWNLTSQRHLNKIIAGINSTPMKCLRFRTPAEAFASSSGVALTC